MPSHFLRNETLMNQNQQQQRPMLSFPESNQSNTTMSSLQSSNGRITSADWKDEYKNIPLVQGGDLNFDASFFDLPAAAVAAAAAAYSGGASRQTSSESTASSSRSLAGPDARHPGAPPAGAIYMRYPPMPSLTGERNARGLSTESWFDPSSLPTVESAARRVSSSDFIGRYVLKEEDELEEAPQPTVAKPRPTGGAKRKRANDSEWQPEEKAQKKKKKSARSTTRTAKRARTPDAVEDAVEEPGPNDVAMGRGGKANNHVGNKRFRAMAKGLRPEYQKQQKDDKTEFSISLVQMVHDRGGRFLAKDEGSGLWYPVDFNKARRKASQALREENRAERAAKKQQQNLSFV